ncbi:putative XPG-I domain-containing protein [Seiridium unicorne]|uniref:XPG-I domain-containing protein n=1 Tax=Seiridium unicorne TaxID=138068 RepID=A0ABR2VD83_9PEZI
MGVNGLYSEVREHAPSKATELAKLNAEWVSLHGRPMRIAVDTPFAMFELKEATQKVIGYGRGDHVLVAPYKPYTPSRSSERSAAEVGLEYSLSHIAHLAREVFNHLGIPWRNAPGEAEAECAELEKAGLVDAVMTVDGDAFVFGSRIVLEKLNAKDGVAMVRQYRMDDLEQWNMPNKDPSSVLTQRHFLQLALMSGGDYHNGIPGCGPKIAFGVARMNNSCYKLYAKLQRDDDTTAWRNELVQGLRSKNLRAVAGAVPAVFPDPVIAGYYMKPDVTTREQLKSWAATTGWEQPIHFIKLRSWTERYFDWRFAHFCGKFVRTLAHPALVKELVNHFLKKTDGSHLLVAIHAEGGDAESTKELRVSFCPRAFIAIDPANEPINLHYQANMKRELFDPHQDLREWFPKWLIQQAAPSIYQAWEERAAAKSRSKKRSSDAVTEGAPKKPRGRPRKQAPSGDPSKQPRPWMSQKDSSPHHPSFVVILEAARSKCPFFANVWQANTLAGKIDSIPESLLLKFQVFQVRSQCNGDDGHKGPFRSRCSFGPRSNSAIFSGLPILEPLASPCPSLQLYPLSSSEIRRSKMSGLLNGDATCNTHNALKNISEYACGVTFSFKNNGFTGFEDGYAVVSLQECCNKVNASVLRIPGNTGCEMQFCEVPAVTSSYTETMNYMYATGTGTAAQTPAPSATSGATIGPPEEVESCMEFVYEGDLPDDVADGISNAGNWCAVRNYNDESNEDVTAVPANSAPPSWTSAAANPWASWTASASATAASTTAASTGTSHRSGNTPTLIGLGFLLFRHVVLI